MSKIYTVKSSAIRAAKKEFGESWSDQVKISEQDGGFVYELAETPKPKNLAESTSAFASALIHDAATAIEEFDEDELERFADAQKAAESRANAAAVNSDPLRPRMSTIPLPTKQVWNIADALVASARADAEKNATPYQAPKRKDVIAECVRQGVAYGTARTQYQHWFKCIADCKAAPIATIGKDGRISLATK